MSVRFNADEILAIAERLEQNAAAFYRTAAEAVQYPGGRQILEDLAAWEEKHERIFSSMREQLTQVEMDETAFDPYDEGTQYLQALADHNVFRLSEKPEAFLGRDPSFSRILDAAIGKEKDSITFYHEMKQMVPAELGKERVDGIIAEEKKHVTILTRKLGEVKD